MDELKPFLAVIADGKPLTSQQATQAFDAILSGQASAAQIGAFLAGLRVRGETVEEITAGAQVMRRNALFVKGPTQLLDTCGTGGDGAGTYNISTAVALVATACGATVAKHGNRALSSKSGSSEVLENLGVRLDLTPEAIESCINETGIGFMFAPNHHSAMRHVGPSRAELGFRTIFNLLGPLSNPAGANRQLLGVFSKAWVEPLAHVLKKLGSERAWVVHGSDGLDELTTTGASHVAELRKGEVRTFEVFPENIGIDRADPADLVGGDPAHNAAALSDMLDGAPGAYRNIVLLNTAAALCVVNKAENLRDGADMAALAIDDGGAKQVLRNLVDVSNRLAGA
ncbi:MAG: anthranilate phosphoribosyltransferase [Rhodobiaceae bacterium]|jgi:anthranilate phosphoribosyltransferase